MIDELINRVKRKWMKLRLQPIRVFCFHHVSEQYNPLTMWECDWTQIDLFKQKILRYRSQGIEFISLPEAYEKLKYDRLRHKKYAVLTADDGYKSILSILPWLEEQKIPITLFINTKYLDGKSWSSINEEQARRVKPDVDMEKEVCPNLYMSKEELKCAAEMPNVTIGMHGHEHLDATKQTIEEFRGNVEKSQEALRDIPHTIPNFAYTWGRHNADADEVLRDMKLVPVLTNGNLNYVDVGYVDRELIENDR